MDALSHSKLTVILLLALIVGTDGLWRFLRDKMRRKGLPLPPGPARVPILGSMLSVDREAPWKTYTKWHAIYGDVFYLRLLDQDVIVLGSQSAAVELLEKRSRIYSDRPFIATAGPYGIEHVQFAFTPYSNNWRSCRRIVHQTYRMEAAHALRPIQFRNALELALSLIKNPGRFEHYYAVFSTALSLSTTYDYRPKASDDPIVADFEAYARAAIPAATPEKAIVFKLLPFLTRIPDWFPGSGLKREAKYAHDLSVRLKEVPYRYTEERMKVSERPVTSMVSNHLAQMDKCTDPSDLSEYVPILKKAAASSLLASGETTVSSLMVFTLAMVLHPHVWKRAQAQIDAIVGTDRIPNFGDRSVLPYIDAIIRETLRWRPVLPLPMHATLDSDIYNGQYIPKGATVTANLWAMSRDKTLFQDAEEFIPERFINDDGTLNDINPMDFIFGFGRRICPGRHAADASLFVAIATMLATFEFHPPKDTRSNNIAFKVKWVHGVTHHPETFPCLIIPRPHVKEVYIERMLAELKSD